MKLREDDWTTLENVAKQKDLCNKINDEIEREKMLKLNK